MLVPQTKPRFSLFSKKALSEPRMGIKYTFEGIITSKAKGRKHRRCKHLIDLENSKSKVAKFRVL